MPPELLHVLGYMTGAILYAMLLVMVMGERRGDRLTLGAALFGVTWNVGELLGHGAHATESFVAERFIAAASFAALGFLPAVVIHSVARAAGDARGHVPGLARWVTTLAYVSASAAGALHLFAASQAAPVPNSLGLILLTASLALLAPVLVLATRGPADSRRAIWMTALAVFAVSALHVGNFHGPRESWAMELLGHHASIPLAFAILYQDYRFALADLFLKQALNLMLVVGIVFGLWTIAGPRVTDGATAPEAIGVLLALWVGSSFLFPIGRRWVTLFVDRVVLNRQDELKLMESLTARLQQCANEKDALQTTCEALGPALSATSVTWRRNEQADTREGSTLISVPTAESPQNVLIIGRLAGGRRLLSGDVRMLERAAVALARRIDTLRLTAERYERVLQEREIRSLATEAELRALRAQINPHFLFNALTTIGHLVSEAPGRAVDTLLRLTTLLRSVLKTEGEFTTLRREAEVVACYLDIERARFEERLSISIEIPEPVADIPIPTLLVQPLVENAVKHGIAHSVTGGFVAIHATLDSDVLHIIVRNSGAPLRGRVPGPLGGVGLLNVERRLANHYGDAAGFSLATSPTGETVADIWLPAAHGNHVDSRVSRTRARA